MKRNITLKSVVIHAAMLICIIVTLCVGCFLREEDSLKTHSQIVLTTTNKISQYDQSDMDKKFDLYFNKEQEQILYRYVISVNPEMSDKNFSDILNYLNEIEGIEAIEIK